MFLVLETDVKVLLFLGSLKNQQDLIIASISFMFCDIKYNTDNNRSLSRV